MISVVNNDFDLERAHASATEAEEPRVSNDGVNGRNERVGDLNLDDETRGFPGHDLGTRKNDIEEGGILSGHGQQGNDVRALGANSGSNEDSGNLVGFEVSSGNDDSDSDFEIEFKIQDREPRCVQNEVVTPDMVAVSGDEDRIEERKSLVSASKFDLVDDHVNMNGIDDDFRLKKGSDLQASMNNNVSSNEVHGVVRAGTMKGLGSQFEMGDMVWGRVKSHPWWPGHIYNEAFASSSVRRTRRDGHILVAFFGDSSYGWFDPSELIPYELHYAEKSQLSNSRNFMKAVEESVDEASRRSALGLSCRCRNPNNFRPASVPGYVAVDVADYDPGAIYSVSQILKAREGFSPAEALSFIKKLALAPSSESKSLVFIKHKAIALAYRRSIFEEFDETYAQAFEEQPARPSQLPAALTDRKPSRAPLSGPLVMTETSGGRKGSKAVKFKEPSKKDRYLFKRRDEAGEFRTARTNQVYATSSLSSAYEGGNSDSAAAGVVFQKRKESVLVNDETAGTPADALTAKVSTAEGLDVTISMDASGKTVPFDVASDSLQSESSALATTKVSEVGQVPEGYISGVTSAQTAGMSSDLVKKKRKKAAKQPAGEQNTLPVKKKKKMQKIDGERSMEHPDRFSSGPAGAYVVKPAVRPMQIGVSSGGDLKKDVGLSYFVPQQMGSVPVDEVDPSEMLADLHGLALHPFRGTERNLPAIVRQFFLKFRSLVFLKSSMASPPSDSEPIDNRATRSTSLAEESCKTVPPLKPSKLSARHKDPTKGGRKRVPSECQEEIATKRAKKITEVKSLGSEKSALLKNPGIHQTDKKTKVGGTQKSPLRPVKAAHYTKRVDRPPRVEEPTYLVMKFQSGSSLPSIVELKARFARFGPLDTSLSRIFYKTNTCRVAFLYKQDANVAHRYAVGSKSLFSNVKFMLRPVAAPETQHLSSSRAEDARGEPASNQDSPTTEPRPPAVQQLKSCLKKPLGGDQTGAPSKATRVRFIMGEDHSGGASSSSNKGIVGVQVQQMESKNALQSSSEGCPSLSSSSYVAMDISNNQRFISSHSLQIPQFRRPPLNDPHVELAPRNNNFNYNNIIATTRPPGPPPPPPPPNSANTDISPQMMSLLTRCHDVVTNVKSILGYVPYHPL